MQIIVTLGTKWLDQDKEEIAFYYTYIRHKIENFSMYLISIPKLTPKLLKYPGLTINDTVFTSNGKILQAII